MGLEHRESYRNGSHSSLPAITSFLRFDRDAAATPVWSVPSRHVESNRSNNSRMLDTSRGKRLPRDPRDDGLRSAKFCAFPVYPLPAIVTGWSLYGGESRVVSRFAPCTLARIHFARFCGTASTLMIMQFDTNV